uniref:Uncharacterized protein n=1 Tax=Cannabis sativa TaxID=3483 RepID=A0A803Q639_CANSA
MLDFVEALLSSLSGDLRKEVIIYIGCVIQAIWKWRNMVRIKGCNVDVKSVITEAATAFLEFSDCRVEDLSQAIPEDSDDQAVQSESANHIMFTDASWKEGVGGYAVVAINCVENS